MLRLIFILSLTVQFGYHNYGVNICMSGGDEMCIILPTGKGSSIEEDPEESVVCGIYVECVLTSHSIHPLLINVS